MKIEHRKLQTLKMVRLLFVLLVLSLAKHGSSFKASGDSTQRLYTEREDRTTYYREKSNDICRENQECMGDHIGYCTNKTWHSTFDCATIGKTCVDAKCTINNNSDELNIKKYYTFYKKITKVHDDKIEIDSNKTENKRLDQIRLCVTGTKICEANILHYCIKGIWYTVSCAQNNKTCSKGCVSQITKETQLQSVASDCTPGVKECIHNQIIVCIAGYWQLTIDCTTLGKICENGVCEDSTLLPGTTPTGSDTTITHIEITSDATSTVIETTTTTNIDTTTDTSCTTGTQVCSGSVIVKCSGGQWNQIADCANMGMTCFEGFCAASTLPTSTSTICPMQRGDIFSISANVSVLNLEDTSCHSFYNCTGSTNTGGLFICVLEQCSSNLVFDVCLGYCTSSATCSNIEKSCYSETCPSPRPFQSLTNNKMLGYACINIDGQFSTLWTFCPNGEVTSGSGGCTAGETSCTNGLNVLCTSEGPIPIPETNCKYRWCYADGSHVILSCLNGYYYDDSSKRCIQGKCTNFFNLH